MAHVVRYPPVMVVVYDALTCEAETMRDAFIAFEFAFLLVGCGGTSTSDGAAAGSGGTGGSGGAADGGTAGQPTGGTGGTAGSGGTGSGVGCSTASDAIAAQTAGYEACTAVVRIAYSSHAILAHAFRCGSGDVVDEAKARATATADTSYGEGSLLGGPTPADEWVFYEVPTDLGGVGVVSSRSGLSVFGGSIIWAGMGSITFPVSWESAPLGSDCPVHPKPKVRGVSLAQGGISLAQAEVDLATDIVWKTAVPAGLGQNGPILDAVILLYAPEVGYSGPDAAGFNPKTAEYIVFVNSGGPKQ